MTTSSGNGAAVPAARARRGRRLWGVIAASVVGTSLEWYDFFLYGTAAALVFGKLFFPTSDPLVGTLLAFATYAVGFVARPVGGVIAGHIGDRSGRRRVLVGTLLVMGLRHVSRSGCLPTYGTIGVAAPILLVTLRFVQGLGLGGEWGGAVLMVSEHGDERRRGLYASWPQVGVPAGNLLAAGVLALLAATLSDDAFTSWGWRIPFLLSAAARRRRAVHPAADRGVAAVQGGRGDGRRRRRARCSRSCASTRASSAIAFGARLGTDVAFYVFALFIITYVTTELGLSKSIGAGRRAHRLGPPALPHPGLRRAVGPRGPAARLRRPARWARCAVGVRLLPAAGHEGVGLDRGRRRRRPALPRAHVRAAGGVHLRAVRHAGALQRRLARLPAGRRGGRGAGADHRDRAARRLRLLAAPSRSTSRAALLVTLVALAVARESAGEDLEETAAGGGGTAGPRPGAEPGSRRCARRDACAAPASAWTWAARSPTSSRWWTAGW